MITQKIINNLSYGIIGCAIEVHKELGPGLLESVYEKCLVYLLREEGYKVEQQKSVKVNFRGVEIDSELRPDVIVDDLIVVELKAVEKILPIHEAQLLTYMNLLKTPKGILINFNCTNIWEEGQITMVNKLFAQLPKGY